jgi:hypothetical protein
MALAILSCSSNKNGAKNKVVTKIQDENSSETSEGSDRWDQYFLLAEKDFIYLAKTENNEEYSKFEYGSWDEYSILKYMSNKCLDSYTFPYGFMSAFFDTSMATDYRSAIVSYVCVASAGRGLVNTIFLEIDEKDNSFTADNLFTDDYDFGFELVKKVGNEIDFQILDGDTRDKKGDGKISFEEGKPIVELTSSNDDFINRYIKTHGSIFNEDLWILNRS